MGIKYLTSYLQQQPALKHEVCFTWTQNDEEKTNATSSNSATARKLIVWDCLNWMHRLYRANQRSSKLFTDFKALNEECRQLVAMFARFGFQLVPFIDGRLCTDKIDEKRKRKRSHFGSIRSNIRILKQLRDAALSNGQRTKLIKKLKFIPSSGFATYLEQSLAACGCKVFRGATDSDHDIDKDMAQFAYRNQHEIYGILSSDTDFFGYSQLPAHIRLISEFHIKSAVAVAPAPAPKTAPEPAAVPTNDSNDEAKEKESANAAIASSNKNGPWRNRNRKELTQQKLSLTYYYASELWQQLKLNNVEQRLQLICLCGNDFVKGRRVERLLTLCGVDVQGLLLADLDDEDENGGDDDENGDDEDENEVEDDGDGDGDGDEEAQPQQDVGDNTDNAAKVNDADVDVDVVDEDESKTQKEAAKLAATVHKLQNSPLQLTKKRMMEIVAESLFKGTFPPSEVSVIPPNVREFYTLNVESKTASAAASTLVPNINSMWSEIQHFGVYHGGFFVHDIDKCGFGIHQKMSELRHAVMRKYMHLDAVQEYIPVMDADGAMDVLQHQQVDLQQQYFDRHAWNVQLLQKHGSYETANLYIVHRNALQLVWQRQWISTAQYNALSLQFEIRFNRHRFPKWFFYKQFATFRRAGIPNTDDLTPQWLYLECARLICLNPLNILPNVYLLFDGGLYHFFCHVQHTGDEQGIIAQLQMTLQEIRQKVREQKHQKRMTQSRRVESSGSRDSRSRWQPQEQQQQHRRNFGHYAPKQTNDR